MKKVLHREFIVLHHTAAEEKDTEQVKRAHLRRGFRDIGYNFIIEQDGRIVKGRSLDIPGAHCAADQMNYRSIGYPAHLDKVNIGTMLFNEA